MVDYVHMLGLVLAAGLSPIPTHESDIYVINFVSWRMEFC